MKKLVTRFVVFPVVAGIAFAAHAQAATIFDNNTTNKVVPNCTIRKEYNDFTKQYTNNEICSPRVYEVSKNQVSSQPSVSYSSPITNAISSAIPNSLAKYFGGTSYAVPYYSSSPFWNTPSNSYGYNSDRMLDTYYRGGPSDYTGYYDYLVDDGYYGRDSYYDEYGPDRDMEDYLYGDRYGYDSEGLDEDDHYYMSDVDYGRSGYDIGDRVYWYED